MAVDGAFIRHIKNELLTNLKDSRVSQVYQPNRDEIILNLRTFDKNKKLLISTRANSPRIGITQYSVENPDKPPMFCMLLRKKLTGARLEDVRQPGMERMLMLDFMCVNELGDKVKYTLAVELMGKHSNVVLVDGDGVITDALKRVDVTLSSKRLVLPSLLYELPPSQDKLSLEETSCEDLVNAVMLSGEDRLDKAILSTITGLSPTVCRELCFLATGSTDTIKDFLCDTARNKLREEISTLKTVVLANSGKAIMLKNSQGKLFDVSFMEITQYGDSAEICYSPSFCSLLDSFYHEKESAERMRVKTHSLNKLISNNIERLSRKISLQRIELEKCKDREILRQKGDLIGANMHLIKKGVPFADVVNFYDENAGTIRIALDVSKTPQQNAQKYYKDYAKAKTADKMLRVQIDNSVEELSYLDSVAHEINSAQNEQDLMQIRAELCEQGYLKEQKQNRKNIRPKTLKPDFREFKTSDGFTVLVGKNNKQNDLLTLKCAQKNDVWFHTKDIPGSHTVLVKDAKEVSEQAIYEAAQIAAYFSKAKDSSQVPVDYTLVRKVSKPQGAKPGKVIYTDQHTLFVKPKIYE